MTADSLPIPDDAKVECLGINFCQLRQLMDLLTKIQIAHVEFAEAGDWKYSREIGDALTTSCKGPLQDLVKKGVDELIAKGNGKK